LKRRTDASVINEENPAGGFSIGNSRIAFENGQILLSKDGKTIDQCSISEFGKTPNAIFRRFMAQIRMHEDKRDNT